MIQVTFDYQPGDRVRACAGDVAGQVGTVRLAAVNDVGELVYRVAFPSGECFVCQDEITGEDVQPGDTTTSASFCFKPDDRVRILGGKFEGCEGVIDFASLTRDGVRYTLFLSTGERAGDHLFIAEPQLALLPAHAEPHPEAAALVDETGQPENVNP